jgi:hypothetical protein
LGAFTVSWLPAGESRRSIARCRGTARCRGNVDPESLALDDPLVAGQVRRFAELELAVGARRAGPHRADANTEDLRALLGDELLEMRLGGGADRDHAGQNLR